MLKQQKVKNIQQEYDKSAVTSFLYQQKQEKSSKTEKNKGKQIYQLNSYPE